MVYYVDYNSVKVPFNRLHLGGIDHAIRNNWMVGTERELYDKLITPGDIVYDIGAYIGTHAVQFAMLGGIVYAFEPSIHNFDRCVEHCRPFKQIKVFDVGFHDKSYTCQTKFKDCNNQKVDDDSDPVQPIKYEVLEDFIEKEKLPPPDFIKMDVEGMETSVLKTFDKIFRVFRPTLHIEIHYTPGAKSQNYPDNPHWLTPEEGGFDFNVLSRKYFYFVMRSEGHWRLNTEDDLNNFSGYSSLVCMPVERFLKAKYYEDHE